MLSTYLIVARWAVVATTLICLDRAMPINDRAPGLFFQVMPFIDRSYNVRVTWKVASLAILTSATYELIVANSI